MPDAGLTIHRLAWRRYRRLPRFVQVWLVLVLLGAAIELPSRLAGPGEAQHVTEAVMAALARATGPDPAGACGSVAPGHLATVLSELGAAPAPGSDPLAACRAEALRLRSQATPAELADLAGGSVRSVQFRADGGATVVLLAHDRRLGGELTLRHLDGAWLIDGITVP